MKVNFVKCAGGTLVPADDLQVEKLTKLGNGEEYEVDIKLKQNCKLHRKMMKFFSFCTDHYYGDSNAHKDEYQFNHVRKWVTISAGYHKQMWNREGTKFELVALSLKFDKMPQEERAILYPRVVTAAVKMVFNNCTDENTLNQLYNFF